MNSALIVGFGDLGGKIARLLSQSNFEVTGVRYSDKPARGNVQTVQADVTDSASLKSLENLNPEIIVYCVAANARNDESYRRHYVEGLANILATQENNNSLKHVFFVSSTRVYGQNTSALLDENDLAEASDFGGERLLEAEALLQEMPCNTTALRLSGIYGSNRLYMLKMSQNTAGWPVMNKWTNRIHRDDAAGFIVFLCKKVIANESLHDCYIVTDDAPTLQYDVLMWLAKQQSIDVSSIKIPPTEGGKQLSNKRLKATGFELKYPNYKIGYREILEQI